MAQPHCFGGQWARIWPSFGPKTPTAPWIVEPEMCHSSSNTIHTTIRRQRQYPPPPVPIKIPTTFMPCCCWKSHILQNTNRSETNPLSASKILVPSATPLHGQILGSYLELASSVPLSPSPETTCKCFEFYNPRGFKWVWKPDLKVHRLGKPLAAVEPCRREDTFGQVLRVPLHWALSFGHFKSEKKR